MNKLVLLLILFSLLNCTTTKKKNSIQKFHVSELQNLPEATTNNAVSEGFINGDSYVFSFGGLDSTKKYTGIHKRSYRLDVIQNKWKQLADLPDTLGKIASAASRIKDTIYIIGGYHVFKDHSEKSSNKVHRYDIKNNLFLKDGASVPVQIDDHVQAVWRDSLIYVVTGWSDTKNMPNVQIYNPSSNSWNVGTSTPNNHIFKSFGASGMIIKDTIFYFGGASMGKHYPIQNVLRKGIINPDNPNEIDWTHQILDSTIVGYRMAATSINSKSYWLGGSTTTYNYNPVAYNGSGGVNPSNRILTINKGQWLHNYSHNLPMDLRGVAEINDSTKIVVGGILKNQRVTKKTYLIEWK